MRIHIMFLCLLSMTACGQKLEQTSTSSAIVSEEQAVEAFKVVQAIDYLPFTFIVDGCYARSLYMSLELAAEGIPSSAHYVYGRLQPTKSVSWTYHVAPLLQVEDSEQEPWILDPAFETEPLTRTEWVNKDFAAATKVSLKELADKTKTRIRAGSAYFDEKGRTAKYDSPTTQLFQAEKNSSGTVIAIKPKPIDSSRLIRNFEEMPTFLTSDIHSACTVMYNYIGRETVSPEQKQEKIKKLLLSTARLIQTMQDLKKLTQNGSSSTAQGAARACNEAMAGNDL